MTFFFLLALLLLTVVLGRLRQLRTRRFSRLIPSMTFFRVALAAALMSRVLIGFGLQGEIVDWIAVVAKTKFPKSFRRFFSSCSSDWQF